MNIEHIAQNLGLKKHGGEYKGPCPICGGDDRFHIKHGKQADLIVLCRHGCRYADIMRLLEDRQLVPKQDQYVRPTYLQRDLDYCDALMMVVESDLDRGRKFKGDDILAISRMISLVDPSRQNKLHQLMEAVRHRIDE